MKMLKKTLNRIKHTYFGRKYECLDGNGERVDIDYNKEIKFDDLDMYQKSHYRRYEFAKNLISPMNVNGDFACGTGYGSVMLSDKSHKVVGVDINKGVIDQIKFRYRKRENIEFFHSNLLDLKFQSIFDNIISFETIEHLKEEDIPKLFGIFSAALKPGGLLIFSMPFMQERSWEAINMGFHLTFNINEKKMEGWLSKNNLLPELFKYQSYQTHNIEDRLEQKDFTICVSRKSHK